MPFCLRCLSYGGKFPSLHSVYVPHNLVYIFLRSPLSLLHCRENNPSLFKTVFNSLLVSPHLILLFTYK